ncbi:MAG: RNA polymerase sigma factor [Ruminococcus sp.]|nr:RNA polymerase sigma factor [Ruminococcus sp.]
MADIEGLYKEYYSLIFKYLFSLSKDSSLSEELTQETFYRAFVNIAKLRDDAKAVAWLCSIAKNLYFAWYKNHKRFETSLEQDTLSAEDTADKVETKFLTQECMYCVNRLQTPYKEVFLLSVFGGLSFKEISLAFHKSESWARVTFYRAKQKIMERLEEKI